MIDRPAAARKPVKLLLYVFGGLLAIAILGLALLAAFPWAVLKDRIEDRLSGQIGAPVTIGAMERIDSVSLHPRVRLRDLRMAQPSWAGRGDLASVREVRIGFSAMALLLGRFRLEMLDLEGGRINLVRREDGLESWTGRRSGGGEGGGGPVFDLLRVRDTQVSYRDAKQNRSFDVALTVDPARGLAMSGSGLIHGSPVTVRARGGPIGGAASEKPWPFVAVIDGAAVGMRATGTMDHPLATDRLNARVTAHGDDLLLIDAIIEGGLPATQPVKVAADVRRDGRDWTVRNLAGTIGRSDIAGDATIRKIGDRTRIDGVLKARRFDFDDLASDEGRRIAAGKRARYGDRIIPDTAIDLATVDRTDGRLEVSAQTLLWPGSAPFRSMSGVLTLDRSRLEIAPLTLGLTRGRMEGRAVVDQRSGRPLMTLAFYLRDARLLDFFPDAAIDGSLRGRARLTGEGRTVREAVGRSSGMIALAARDGTIPARTASLLGQDIGRGLTSDEDELATLRCIVARFDVAGGQARASSVVIDTSRASTRVTGKIDLASERMSLALNGAPKQGSILRLSGSVPVGGTIQQPAIRVPEQTRSIGGILKMVGKAIAGQQGPTAADADCAGLEQRAFG